MKVLEYKFYNDYEWVGPEIVKLNGNYWISVDDNSEENKDLTEDELYKKYLADAKKSYAKKVWEDYISEYTDFL